MNQVAATRTAHRPDSEINVPGSNLEPPRRALDGPLKRVLYVLALNPDGKFSSLAEQGLVLAREFRARGSLFLPVYLPPLDPDFASTHAVEGVAVEALDLRYFRIGTLLQLVRMIRRHQIEIVHWNFYHPLFNGYLWALSALQPGIEHYFTDHISRPANRPGTDGPGRLKLTIKRILARRYRKILCVSDFVLAQVRESSGLEAARIHHFINTDRFKPEPSVRVDVRLAVGVGDEFVALVVAHLIKDKGIDIALKALVDLPDQVVLWIAGEGQERRNLEDLAQDLKVAQRVRFLGPRRNVEPLMQAADCVVTPSNWAEAAALVNLEALACGLPVVASRVGGIPEFVADGRNGFLFTRGDPRQLAERILQLYNDPERRRRMGHQARSDAVDHFSTQRLMSEYLEIYRREASGKGL